jgi:hypothetical protein
MNKDDVYFIAKNVGFELLVDNSNGEVVVSTPDSVCDITEKLKEFSLQVEERTKRIVFDNAIDACLKISKDRDDLANTCATEINKIANKKKAKHKVTVINSPVKSLTDIHQAIATWEA